MSQLQQVETPMPQVALDAGVSETAKNLHTIDNTPMDMSHKQAQGKTYSRRVVLHTTATRDEIAAGKQVEIKDSAKVFQPDFDAAKDLLDNVDTTKGIITKVEVLSIYSNCPAPVTMGMKLFSRAGNRQASCEDLKITNESGWLYSCSTTALGQETSHSKNNFTNILAMQPYERTRVAEGMTVYKPSNILQNRYISEYGKYDWKRLWENIVQFPGESFYYVDKSHVILKVIENNWELLGLDLRSEIPREGKYVKVATAVADRVIKELYDNVISRIPFTSFKNLKAVFTSDAMDLTNEKTKDKEYSLMTELRVSFVYPAMSASEAAQ